MEHHNKRQNSMLSNNIEDYNFNMPLHNIIYNKVNIIFIMKGACKIFIHRFDINNFCEK